MTLRSNVMDSFVLFRLLVQPLIIALLALWMLQDRGGSYAIFVVVGSGMTGLWSSLLFVSGNSITVERWIGTLEALVGVPTPLAGSSSWQEPGQCACSRCCRWSSPTCWPRCSSVIRCTVASAAAVLRLAAVDMVLSFIAFGHGDRADLRHQSRRAALAERHGVPGLHPVRLPVSRSPCCRAGRRRSATCWPPTGRRAPCISAHSWGGRRRSCLLGHDAGLSRGLCC